LQTKFVVFSFANEWICYPDRYFQINWTFKANLKASFQWLHM
jgi:hypothetical protein